MVDAVRALSRHSASNPQGVAIVDRFRTVTWSELNDRVNAISAFLMEGGASAGTFVAVLLGRGPDAIAALLAIHKTGAAYVPIDPANPAERIESVRHQVGKHLFLTSREFQTLVGRDRQGVVFIEEVKGGVGGAEAAYVAPAPGDPAYVIFTSGSTGSPKGVVIDHLALRTFIESAITVFELTDTDRVLQFASLSFDASVEEIFPAIQIGAAIVLRDEVLWTPSELADAVERHGITVLDLPTSYWHELVDAQTREATWFVPEPVRLVILGGEAADVARAQRWNERAPRPIRLVNTYGPTEATVSATIWDVPRSVDLDTVLIGRPFPHVEARVLNAQLEEVEEGETGELFLGGPSIAQGYIGQPALTAENFVAASSDGLRLYRTGDLVRVTRDGLAFIGRRDDQVKLSGYRVELGEIESAARRVVGVTEAVAAINPDSQTLGLFVAGEKLSTEIISTRLAELLPSYMRPTSVVVAERLPKTVAGKIDRQSLWRLVAPVEMEPTAPGDDPAAVVLAVLREVLGVDIGPKDDFLGSGGNSLKAAQLVSRIAARLRKRLTIADVFSHPTAEALVTAIEYAAAAERVAIEPAEESREFGLTPEQERIWFFEQFQPGTTQYVIPAVARLEGHVDEIVLRKALEELSARHPALRTTFRSKDGTPMQAVHDDLPIPFVLDDVRRLEDPEEAAQLILQREVASPLDLENGPPARARLIRISDGSNIFSFCVHHLVSDGWSIEVIARDLTRCAAAFHAGESMPPLPKGDFASFARSLQQFLVSDSVAGSIDYWKHRLEGAPVIDLPLDHRRPKIRSFTPRHHRFSVPEDLTAEVGRIATNNGATLFMSLLSAFSILVSRYASVDDVVIGTPIAGRDEADLEDVVGLFVNIICHRIGLPDSATFAELLTSVRDQVLVNFEHRGLPFEHLIKSLELDRDPSRPPVAQVMFALHNTPDPQIALPSTEPTVITSETNAAPVDLTLDITENDGFLEAAFHYNGDLFTPETIDRMARHFVRLLESIVSDASAPLSELEMMDENEYKAVVDGWNQTAAPIPDVPVHESFREMAHRYPKRIAAQWGEHQVTYEELDDRSDRLASELLAANANGKLVGICAERSIDMIVGMLGILKAGAAYLPLDPEHPTERLKFMLNDAGVSILLSDRMLLEHLPEVPRILFLDDELPASKPPPIHVGSNDLAYVIYTSGSTGIPKGICIPHRGITRLVRNTDYLQLGTNDVVAQAANASFDAATFEIWGPLLNGGRLVGIDKDTLLSPKALEQQIARDGINVMFVTTALFNQIAVECPEAFGRLDHLLFGGEAVDPRRVRYLLRTSPPGRILHVYGPTETTTFATWHEFKEVPEDAVTIAIGKPLANTTAYICDPRLRPVPVGICGEILIGGPGVGTGYLNRPDLTAERFVPSPFEPDGGTLYRTGDLARFLPDGSIEFIGRKDHQVKIRGFRIELGEVEAALLAHPEIEDAVVLVREDEPGEKKLVAYVVMNTQEPSIQVKGFLRTSLPSYMVPSSVVVMESLPWNANAKIDRSVLPEPRESESRDRTLPRTDMEEQIARIWSQVLDVSEVGVDESFFDLGGHSLLATRIVSRINEAFDVDLPLRALFDASTIERFAPLVERSRGKGSSTRPKITRQPRTSSPSS